jgi:protein transport protein SEC20
MPPLPSTLSSEIQDAIASARRRHKDLSEFQIPRLQNCLGPLSVQQNLASELREDVDVFARQVEALSVLVGDQKGERNRRELGQVVAELEEALARLRKDSRTALLSSKRAIDSQNQSRRDELLNSSALNNKQVQNEKITDDALMKASDDVTEALRRTIGLMQGELERSVLTSQMLDASSASLQSTSTMHDTLNNLMGTSKQLITALEKSDWLDRLLILSGLAFFFLVVLFILKQRIVDRGLRVAFWWTRFLPSFSGELDFLSEESKAILASSGVASTLIASSSTLTSTTRVESQTGNVEASADKLQDIVREHIGELPASPLASNPASVDTAVDPARTNHNEL